MDKEIKELNIKFSDKPPKGIYEKAKEKWDRVDFENGTTFTVGTTIHCKFDIPDHLVEHETHHVIQQTEYKGGYKKWWDRYFKDDKFRLEQEIECYRKQYKFIVRNCKDRNDIARYLNGFSSDLSGSLYGNLVSFPEAFKLIKMI